MYSSILSKGKQTLFQSIFFPQRRGLRLPATFRIKLVFATLTLLLSYLSFSATKAVINNGPKHGLINFGNGDGHDQYYDPDYLRLDNFTYRDYVKTVTLHPLDWPLAPAVIYMDEPDQVLELGFDVLDSALVNYKYTFIHCDADWTQSELDIQEYIDGLPYDFITDYGYSRNTYQRFIHYSLTFPNFNIRFTKSGNYVIKVWDPNTEELLLTRRFCIAEKTVDVKANIHRATMVSERNYQQEVDFTLETGNYTITNPYKDLSVTILQNHAWPLSIKGLQPRFVKESVLDYDHDGDNAMNGGNEYRLFSIKDTRFTGPGLERVTYDNQENHAYLELDEKKRFKTYLQRQDINGRRYIKTDRLGASDNLDADYVHVHFRLAYPEPITDGELYVYGELTDWQFIPEARLEYDYEAREYKATMYLKQGLYNYIYAKLPDGRNGADISFIEGTHADTENEYAILVYHRGLGLDYDRLLAYETFFYPPK